MWSVHFDGTPLEYQEGQPPGLDLSTEGRQHIKKPYKTRHDTKLDDPLSPYDFYVYDDDDDQSWRGFLTSSENELQRKYDPKTSILYAPLPCPRKSGINRNRVLRR